MKKVTEMNAEGRAPLTEKFEEALVFAVRKHAGQCRKRTDIPYISHLLAAAGLVLEHGGTEEEVIAALLHDAAEDQGGLATLAEIRSRFGDNVAEIVVGCSDDMPEAEEKKRPWMERKTGHLEHMKHAARGVLLVSLADKIHNLRSILTDLHVASVTEQWKRFNATPAESRWYYRSMHDIFAGRQDLPVAMVKEMTGLVETMERQLAAEANLYGTS